MPRLPERIETARLVLRQARLDDAEVMFNGWTQDPEVTRYLTWRPHTSVSNAIRFVEGAIAAWDSDIRQPYVMTSRGDDTPIGIFEVRFESFFAASFGYVLRRSAWSHGYMTEAARAVLDVLFALPEIYRVWAFCDVENVGSARVMEKSGMQHEGTLRRNVIHPNISETPRDAHIYARVR